MDSKLFGNKLSNVIGTPIPQWLINQFNIRAKQNTLNHRNSDNLKYLANKTAWVRLVSSVNIGEKDLEYFKKNTSELTSTSSNETITDASSLAKNFILFSGMSKYQKNVDSKFGYDLRSGLDGAYGMLGENEINKYGYQPMPGITSVNIETMGRLGSIRSATINFKVFNKLQLDIVDALYFKLGYTMFLEWGNTYYYKTPDEVELTNFENSKNYQELTLSSTEDLIIDPFEKELTKEAINYKIAQNVKKSYGNYDGMLGVVTNFNFTRKEDSSYDCTLKIIGLGALAESIKVNRSDFFTEILKEEIRPLVESENKKIESQKEAKSNEFKTQLKQANDSIVKIREDADKLKTFEEVFQELEDQNPQNHWPSLVETSPGSFSLADYENKNIADKVLQKGNYWGIKKFSAILKDRSEDFISSVTLSSIALKEVFEKYKRDKNFEYINPNNSLSTNRQLVYDFFYDATSKKLPYSIRIGIDLNDVVKTLNSMKSRSVNGVPSSVEFIGALIEQLFDYLTTNLLKQTDNFITQDIKKAIYKELTERDKTFYPQTESDISLKVINESIPLLKLNGFLESFKIDAKKIALLGNPLTRNKFDLSKYIAQNDEIYEAQIPFYVEIEDSALIKEIEFLENLPINLQTKEQFQLEKRKEIERLDELRKSALESIKQLEEDLPLIVLKTAQDQETNKYSSSIEVLLRSIQIHALNRVGEGTKDVRVVDLLEVERFYKKTLQEVGLYSSMYDKLFSGNPQAIEDIAGYGENLDSLNKNSQEVLEFYAKYGFNNALLSGTNDPSKLKEMLFDHRDLYKAYVIPKEVSQEFAKVLDLNRPVHIQFGTLLMLLNHVSLIYDVKDPKNVKNRTPLVYIDYNPNTNFCLSTPNHLSTNPLQFLIPYAGSKEDFTQLFDKDVRASVQEEGYFDPQENDNISRDIPQFKKFSSNNKDAYRGSIMNILIDVQYILQTLRRFSAVDGTNSVYLKSFLESILSDMSKCLGNYNIFRLAYNDAGNCLYIIDDQLTPPKQGEEVLNKTTPINRTEIPLYGVTSLAKTLEIRTDISSRLSNMIAISSNSPDRQGTLSTDSTSFGFINSNFTDRYIPLKDDVKSDSKDETPSPINDGDKDAAKTFNDAIKRFYGDPNISVDAISVATNYYIARMSRVKSENSASRASAMIPVSINFSTDGISGFNMYQSFTVNEELLPYTYTTYNVKPNEPAGLKKVGFCVVGLNHTIEGNQWNTFVKSNMIFLKNESDYNYVSKTTPPEPKKIKSTNRESSKTAITTPIPLVGNQENVKKAIAFFTRLGYKDYQVSAIVGGLMQESEMNPLALNKVSKALGIAQWLGSRQRILLERYRNNYYTLDAQLLYINDEFLTTEKTANNLLKSSRNIKEAITAMAVYERYAGISKGANTTYQDVIYAPETGKRIGYTRTIYKQYFNKDDF